MSTLTTIEELQKQLTLILGFSGKENLDVGEIIGVGKLTKEKTHELVLKVLEYLNAYNAMLRDYSGTEIYSIEFELKNFLPKRNQLKLLPESMILIPREYKETNTIILALTYTTSLLDMDKSQNSIAHISKLFFEILEMADRPELNNHEKVAVLTKFAKRFARKVQGELVERNWNKKLVGIRSTSVDDEGNLEPFGELQSKYKIKWNLMDREIHTESPTYRNLQFTLPDDEKLNHLKWQVSGPSGYYIAQKTILQWVHHLPIWGWLQHLQPLLPSRRRPVGPLQRRVCSAVRPRFPAGRWLSVRASRLPATRCPVRPQKVRM